MFCLLSGERGVIADLGKELEPTMRSQQSLPYGTDSPDYALSLVTPCTTVRSLLLGALSSASLNGGSPRIPHALQ